MNPIFSYVHPRKAQKALGPFSRIRLNSDGMRSDGGEALLARYHNHLWSIEGEDYYRLDCASRVVVHFEGLRKPSAKYGPYERFSAVNGLSYGDDRVIAFLDVKINEWLYYDTGYHWPEIIITGMPSAR